MMIQANRLVLAIVAVGSLAGCANMSSGEQRTLAGAAGGWLYNRHEQAQSQ